MSTGRAHDTPEPPPDSRPAEPPPDTCDYCGSDRVIWRSCKLICLNCGQIVKSCADL